MIETVDEAVRIGYTYLKRVRYLLRTVSPALFSTHFHGKYR